MTTKTHTGAEWTSTATIQATIQERGNGWPDTGDYVSGDDGHLYRVVSLDGPIHTDAAGAPHYIHATVEAAEWDDISDEQADDIICTCTVDDDDSEER